MTVPLLGSVLRLKKCGANEYDGKKFVNSSGLMCGLFGGKVKREKKKIVLLFVPIGIKKNSFRWNWVLSKDG